MTQIFIVKNYKNKRDNNKNILKGTSDSIINALSENKGYHQLLMNNINYNLFLDVDGIDNSEDHLIYELINKLSDILDIDMTDIKFTVSKKDTLSYHITIPCIHGNLETQKHFVEQLKQDFNYIDLCIYQNNRWFRLPNQTNKDKPVPHTIINGKMIDFVLDIIQPKSELIKIDNNNPKKPTTPIKSKGSYISDVQLKEMLLLLPSEYLNEYSKWIIITNILKNLNKFDIWDEWSKQSENYNSRANISIWNSTKKIMFNVAYLIKLTNYKTFKPYKPITNNHKIKLINNKFLFEYRNPMLNFTFTDYSNNDTIIIQSCTGTGKTTAVAEHCKNYLKDSKYKILSIISRITLGDQHVKSFKEKNIDMFTYSKGFVEDHHFIVCINSLLLLNNLTDDELKKYIVFIDEINTFIEHITHNDTLHSKLKQIYTLLIRIIKNAHKVIVADALISDNVFTLLKTRSNEHLYIKNDYKKYEGIKATRLKDENDFKKELEQHIKDKKYFFFGCDSCTIIEEFYYYFLEQATNKDDFILFTANHKFNITDANEQFKNKFLFFSPAITTAVDFNIQDKQDVFIYIKGNTILPSGSFQQTTRTRNINQLYYYCSKDGQEAKFETLEDVKDQYNKMIIQNDILTDMSMYIDEDDNIKMSNNGFFNLFCYNEYVKDTYNTNKLYHYENILLENKFVLSNKGEQSKNIDSSLKFDMKIIKIEINDKIFDDFLIDRTKEDNNYIIMNERIELLGLTNCTNDILIKYKSYIQNPHVLSDHLNILRFFKNNYYIQSKILMMNENNYKVKLFNDTYNKISIFRNIPKRTGFVLDNLDFNNDVEFNIDTEQWNYIKKLFRYTKDKPNNKAELKPIIISMIKSITNNNIIDSKQTRHKNIKERNYMLNMDFINEHLELDSYTNSNKQNYDIQFNNILSIKEDHIYKSYIGDIDKDLFND